jgi:hypothetical protein
MDGKRGTFSTALCQSVNPEESSYTLLSTKVEIVLAKGNGMSWPTLEPSRDVKSWTTFGTVGGVGTVGSKEAIIASDSPVSLLAK